MSLLEFFYQSVKIFEIWRLDVCFDFDLRFGTFGVVEGCFCFYENYIILDELSGRCSMMVQDYLNILHWLCLAVGLFSEDSYIEGEWYFVVMSNHWSYAKS